MNAQLINAVNKRELVEVQELIAAGANVNKANKDSITPLLIASANGHTEVVKALLDTPTIDVNKTHRNGATPLLMASTNGHKEVVKALLEKPDIDINKANKDGFTPLLMASTNGHKEVVKALLENPDIDINKANEDGYTPLLLAGFGGHTIIARELLEAGASITYVFGGESILEIAESHGFSPAINALIISIGSHKLNIPMPKASRPINAPLQCFDPYMASEVNIGSPDSTTFFILKESGEIISTGCLDKDSLKTYKESMDYLFYRCKDTTPISALYINHDSVLPTKYRLLNFAMRIYVKDSEAQQLKSGKEYVLKPVELLGRIVSHDMVEGGSAISSIHCGPADGSKLYSIFEVSQTGGRRRRRSSRKLLKTYKKKRQQT